MNVQKETLRKKLIEKRLALSKEEAAISSSAISQKLLDSVDWDDVKNLHIYSSVAGWNEVDTAQIKNKLRSLYPRISITSRPPKKTEPIPSGLFDLIIVPVLGFDPDNYRLGLGGGWYDRFLAKQPQAQTIGLAYSFSSVHTLPHESHDIPLDRIITEL